MPFYSSPPAAPSRNNPSDFNERADDFFAWFPVAVDEFDEASFRRGMLLIDNSNSEVAPNNVTVDLPLWNGLSFGGQGFRFTAAADNTGDFTVTQSDGGSVFSARTITGAQLPAGFIQAGKVYTAYIDPATGLYHIRRPLERISNANGRAIRLEDGTQICYHAFNSSGGPTTASGVLFISADDTWTFPAPFVSAANLSVRGNGGFSSRWVSFGSPSATSMAVRQHQATSGAAVASLRVMAIGSWY